MRAAPLDRSRVRTKVESPASRISPSALIDCSGSQCRAVPFATTDFSAETFSAPPIAASPRSTLSIASEEVFERPLMHDAAQSANAIAIQDFMMAPPLAAGAGLPQCPASRKERCMPAYVVVDIEVTNPSLYERYKELAGAAVAKHGGKYLARGGATTVLEGSWQPKRLVVLEFPSVEKAKAWWASTDYKEAKDIRQKS